MISAPSADLLRIMGPYNANFALQAVCPAPLAQSRAVRARVVILPMQAVRRSVKSVSVVASHFHRAKVHASFAVLALRHRLKVVVRAISALKDATRAVLAAAASLELIRATHARRALSASSPAALPR